MNNQYPLDTTSDMPSQLRGSSPPAHGSVCPDCNSPNLRSVRREYGIKGQWNYWWIEQTECADCNRKMIPAQPGTPNDRTMVRLKT